MGYRRALEVHGTSYVDGTVGDLELLQEAATAGNSGPLSGAFLLLSDPVSELDQSVRAAQTKVDELHGQVSRANVTVGILLQRLPLWIDLASLALTFFFVWFALSQIAVYKLSRRAIAGLRM